VFTTKVTAVNKSGVLVAVGSLNGFVPYKLMDKAKLRDTERDTWTQDLVGAELRVKVTQVVVPERRLICSEKAAMLDSAALSVAPGEVLTGRVISLHEFGAFIEVSTAPYTGAEVILPVREVSWDWIANVNAKLARGDEVRVVVLDVRPPPRAKVVVSLKRLQEDPLRETLDQVLPLEAGGAGGSYADVGSVPATVPSAVEDILDELSREEGVSGVTLGRRVEERRTVSQDLELWMTRDVVDDGYNLVARAGRVVQEIHVATGMEAHEMKAAVQRVLQRVS
jgi:predicted RNA-binding protein with RPS1 domain